VKVALSEVEANFLHHLYATPFVKIKVGETTIDYDMYVDHDAFSGSLGDIHLYDLIQYPYTKDPRNFDEFETENKYEILGLSNVDQKNTLSLDCKFYSDTCPLKDTHVTNTVKLYVASIKYIFQFDLMLRIKDYFFERLLDSVTDTDPYESETTSNLEAKLIKFYEKSQVDDYDLKQENAIIDLHLEAENPCIVIKARNHYTDEFMFLLGNIHVTSELHTVKDKWTLSPKKKVRMSSFKIDIENSKFYHNNLQMGTMDMLKVDFRQLVFSELLEYIDPLALNKAFCTDLNFSPITIQLSKVQFTYLMKCLDLNINYDDGMKEQYDFRKKIDFTEVHKIEDDYKTMVFNINMTSVSLSLYFLNEFLSEIVCQDLDMTVDRFASNKNIIEICSTALWTFGEECEDTGKKQVITGPIGCGNLIYTDASFYNFEVLGNKDLKSLKIDKMK